MPWAAPVTTATRPFEVEVNGDGRHAERQERRGGRPGDEERVRKTSEEDKLRKTRQGLGSQENDAGRLGSCVRFYEPAVGARRRGGLSRGRVAENPLPGPGVLSPAQFLGRSRLLRKTFRCDCRCAAAPPSWSCSSAGAATLAPAELPIGAPIANARAALGGPTGEYILPGGGTRLEFARGSFGRQTWMLDFDSAGRLVRKEQVLTEARFAEIVPG